MLAAAWRAQTAAAPGSAASKTESESVALELDKLDKADDAAQAEADEWLASNKRKKAEGGGISDAELETRITQRFDPVRRGYEEFVSRYPRNARGHLAYGNFLNARDDERGAQREWEKALELDPKNAVLYNNLAGRYGESGPVDKAFEYFGKAIELSPNESQYYHNFADVLYVMRRHATAYYHLDEQGVYGRCLVMYSNALRLDPQNYSYARDLAQTYYSLKPIPLDPALQAWTNALSIARQPDDCQDVYVHLARVKMLAGQYDAARAQLSLVTNQACAQAKANLLKTIQQREAPATPGNGQ